MRKGQKHSEESIMRMRVSQKGHNSGVAPWNKNTSYKRIPRICVTCGKQYFPTNRKQKYCSIHCFNQDPVTVEANKKRLKGVCISKEHRQNQILSSPRGINHWNWKGGATALKEFIYKCFEYRQWKSDVFTRDKWKCQSCGNCGGWSKELKKRILIEAHHIKQFGIILKENNIETLEEARNCEELWNINNGITLCRECHIETDSWGININ